MCTADNLLGRDENTAKLIVEGKGVFCNVLVIILSLLVFNIRQFFDVPLIIQTII